MYDLSKISLTSDLKHGREPGLSVEHAHGGARGELVVGISNGISNGSRIGNRDRGNSGSSGGGDSTSRRKVQQRVAL